MHRAFFFHQSVLNGADGDGAGRSHAVRCASVQEKVTGSPVLPATGYVVKTVFDLRKHSANVYTIYPHPRGNYLLGRIFQLRLPLSENSSIELFAGSVNGEAGYRDGPATEALFNNPNNLVMDDNGDVYVADTRNFAIRKISKGKVTTIAGGTSQKAGYADGSGENARFSSDITLTYWCGWLLISDRGNRLLREIQITPRSCSSASNYGFLSGTNGLMLLSSLILFGICVGFPLGFLLREKLKRAQVMGGWCLMTKVQQNKIFYFVNRSETARAIGIGLMCIYSYLQLCLLCFFSFNPYVKTSSPCTKPCNRESLIMQQLESLFQAQVRDETCKAADLIDFSETVEGSLPATGDYLAKMSQEFAQEFKDK